MHVSNELYSTELPTVEFIENVNKYHNSPDKEEKFKNIRGACEELMQVICNNVPMCADRTDALKSVRLARMWANSAIALEKSL